MSVGSSVITREGYSGISMTGSMLSIF